MSIFAYFGAVLFLLILFQVLSGKGIVRVPFDWHRRNGVLILAVAIIKGLLAIVFRIL